MLNVIDDAGAWLETQLQAQKAFVHGIVFMLIAICMRKGKIMGPDDSVPLSKITFQLILPALLLASISNAAISIELWRVALVSFCAHTVQVAVVVAFSRFTPKENGLRGQWMINMMGCNIGFTYPILLSVPSLAKTVFPVAVVWDLSGNVIVNLVVNYLAALHFSPLGEDIQPLCQPTCKDSQAIAEGHSNEILPSTVGAVSGNDLHLDEAADVEGFPGSQINQTQDAGDRISQHQPREACLIEAGMTSSAKGPTKKDITLRGFLSKLFTNIPFVAIIIALLINRCGTELPTPVDDFLHTLAQPFSVLFFFLIGLNMVWLTIRPRLGLVAQMLLFRITLNGFLAGVIWILPVLPDPAMRHGALFGLCCPVSGLVMSYAIDFGYNRGLQAAMQTCSNGASLVVLWVLLSMV